MRLFSASVVALLLVSSPGRAADIVLGAIYSNAGPGADARQAVETALDILNGTHDPIPVLMGRGGGLDRLGGAKLVVAFADDADPATAAEHLVTKDHAVVLIGGSTNDAVVAISRVANAHKLPFLATNSDLSNADDLPWFFRLGRTEATDARTVLRLLAGIAAASGKPFGTVALLFEDSPAGRDRTAPVRAAADAAGVGVVDVPVADSAVPANLPTADAVLSLIGADAAWVQRSVVPVVLLQRGPTAEGGFQSVGFTADPIPARPAVSIVAAAFQARAGKPLDTVSAREITGVLLLADVLNRAGSSAPIDLRTALMATDTPGSELPMLWEGIRFDDSGQNVRATPALQQMQGGAFKTVAPDTVGVAAPRWPTP